MTRSAYKHRGVTDIDKAMKTTAIIGGDLSGIAVAHMLQKKGIPRENITVFEESPGGKLGQPQANLSNDGKAVRQPEGPFRKQLYREMNIADDVTPSKEATFSTGEEASSSVGHYVWKESASLAACLLVLLLSPVKTMRDIWVYTWFVRESVAFIVSNSVGKMGIKEFCTKSRYLNVWEEYLLPMVTRIWGVSEGDAEMFDAQTIFRFMHEKYLLQVWSPHALVLCRRGKSMKQLIARDCKLCTVTNESVKSVNQDGDSKWRINGKGNAYDNIVFAIKPSNTTDIHVETQDGHRPDVLAAVAAFCQGPGNSSSTLTESSVETGTDIDLMTSSNGVSSKSSSMNGYVHIRSSLDKEKVTNSKRRVFLTPGNVKLSKQVMQGQGVHGVWVTGSYLKYGFDEDAADNADEVSDMIRNSATGLMSRHWSTGIQRRTDLPMSGAFLWFLKTLFSVVLRNVIRKGCIGVAFPDSHVAFFGEKGVPVAMFHIYRMRCIPQTLTFQSIGLGLGYRDQHFNTNDLNLLMYIITLNIFPKPVVKPLHKYIHKLLFLPYIIAYRLTLGINPSRSKKNSADHYGLEDSMFELFLDDTRLYSSAYFKKGTESLYEAQVAKLDLLLDSLEAKDGERLLDMGCGWGGMCSRAALKNNLNVTGITNSKDHKKYCDNLVLKQGIQDRVSIYDLDYRDLPKLFQSDKFDKIVSIEATEHIGAANYSEYFKSLESVLSKDGKICLQVISRYEDEFNWGQKDPNFITHYIFPGTCLPSLGALSKHAARNGLTITSVVNLAGHYETTLHIWRENFNRAVLEGTMLYDDNFARMWNVYFALAESGMASNTIQDFVVTFERMGKASYEHLQTPI